MQALTEAARPTPITTPTSKIAPDLFSALLDVDQYLGQSDEAFRRLSSDPTVRRVIAERTIRPSPLVRRRLIVDHDSRDWLPNEQHHYISPIITAATFPICRSGRQEIELVEIHTDHVLRTRQQLAVMERLGIGTLCRCGVEQALKAFYVNARFPVMAHCGSPQMAVTGRPVQATILQNDKHQRLQEACDSATRWSQDYRLLGVALV